MNLSPHTAMLPEAITVTSENRDELLQGAPFFFKMMATVADKLSYGAAIFILPDGRALKFDSDDGSGEVGLIRIHSFAMARKTLFGGTIGFYESFAAGEWDSPDLAQILYVFAKNADAIQEVFMAHPSLRMLNNVAHALNKNTKNGSKKNIMKHYDLGNDFYAQWLDPSMTYSSAYFKDEALGLEKAQEEKYRALAQRINLSMDETVLEIGSGWGGFAEFAAREVGAKVTGITISQEQYDYACERIQREGLNEKVEFRLQDYRDIPDQFDKLASIEMFEAVGKEYWPTYFKKVHDSLKPGGTAGIQVITIADRYFPFYEKSSDFIQRYVFPGGMLPSPSILKNEIENSGMSLKNSFSFGKDYARTLSKWHVTFLQKWGVIAPLGFDDKFKKLWRFYLAYCEAGFRAQSTDVCQMTMTRT